MDSQLIIAIALCGGIVIAILTAPFWIGMIAKRASRARRQADRAGVPSGSSPQAVSSKAAHPSRKKSARHHAPELPHD